MAVSIDQLKLTMDTLENNFDAAYKAAPDDPSKQALRQALSAARDAYWKAMSDGLTDKNAFVQSLADQLDKKNADLTTATKNLTDFAEFLQTAAEAVKLAAAIATLAAA
jgi:hypothetical protein